MSASINTQRSFILASAGSDGAGGIAVPLRQQGVQQSVGTSGWAFLTDGSDGILVVTVDPAPSSNGFVTVQAFGGAVVYAASAAYTSATTIAVTVRTPATQAVVDLSSTVVAVTVLAANT